MRRKITVMAGSFFLAFVNQMGMLPVVAYAASKNSSPPLPNAGPPLMTYFQFVLSFVIIIALIIVVIRFLARRTSVAERGTIKVLAARQLAQNRSIQVVEISGKRYVLGVGENITLLDQISEPWDESEATLQPSRQSFAASLSSAVENARQRYAESKGKDSKERKS
ncbi:FliO/MopB family protein [Alicyclobacillus tolerans]|uniref:FliO/MopB family protein n=1 Tax=Alicyclobacillus tolerans TaxID=90970 RepID=UPI00093393A6|nr:flagellar biosynthetic protein FliO [Alicyclobacillus montanus]